LGTEELENLDEINSSFNDAYSKKEIKPKDFSNKDFEKFLKKINPNLPYVFSENIFRFYLYSLYDNLENLSDIPSNGLEEIISDISNVEDGLNYFSIGSKFKPVIRKLSISKDYRMFNNKGGKIYIRRINNQNIVGFANYILKKLTKYKTDNESDYDSSQNMILKLKDEVDRIEDEINKAKQMIEYKTILKKRRDSDMYMKANMDILNAKKRIKELNRLLSDYEILFNRD
jgi:hypothetical protein